MRRKGAHRKPRNSYLVLLVALPMIFGVLLTLPEGPANAALGLNTFEVGADEPSGGSSSGIVEENGHGDWLGLTPASGDLDPGEVVVINDQNYVGSAVVTNPESAATESCVVEGDQIVKNGTKINDYPFEVVSGSPSPGKNDICQVYVSYAFHDGDTLVYLGVVRREIGGTTGVALELNKVDHAHRDIGDLLIMFEFDGNGPVSSLTVRKWDGDSWELETVGSDDWDGGSWEYFGEVAVNLSATGLTSPPTSVDDCESFSSVLPYGIAGNSANSNVGDWGGEFPVTIPRCGRLEITKDAWPSADESYVFEWTVTDNDPSPLDPASGPIVDGETVVLDLVAGEYTLEESGVASPYVLDRVECSDGQTAVAPDEIQVSLGSSISCTIYNHASQVVVVKDGAGDGAALFDFSVTDQPAFQLSLGESSESFLFVPGASVAVGETLPGGHPSWDLVAIACRDSQGQDAPGLAIDLPEGSATFNTVAGESITCTYSNEQDAQITVVKEVTNDDGGGLTAEAFSLYLNDEPVTGGAANYVEPGLYTPSEDQEEGYEQVSIVCVDDDTGANLGSTATLSEGQSVTCTITNDDIGPTLTVLKTVVNDDGGTAGPGDFQLYVDGSPVPQDVPQVLSAGSFDLSESGPPGYEQVGDWVCDGEMADGDTVILGLGEDVTCTVTNTDVAPRLTLVKVLDNDDGGNATLEDFILTASGPDLIIGTSGSASVTDRAVDAGSYDLSESGPPGYSQDGAWTCLGGDQVDEDTVVLLVGETATCTVVNTDDPPHLTVLKTVVNDDGGDADAADFQLYVNDSSVSQGISLGGIVANAPYVVSEDGLEGYLQTDLSCTDDGTAEPVAHPVILDEGQSVTCTITNDDIAPDLTVIKTVVNDDGGDAVAADFQLYVNAFEATQGLPMELESNQPYTVSEDELVGYIQTSLTCSDNDSQQPVAHPVILDEGQSVTCTIINDDLPPGLMVIKTVVNDDGGDAVAADFQLYVNSSAVDQGVALDVLANVEYTITEDNLPGYEQVGITCEDARGDVGHPVTLDEGQVVVCTIVNDDIAPDLTVIKSVVNNDGGDAGASDFQLYLNDSPVGQGLALEVLSNTEYEVSEDQIDGYAQTDLSCVDNDSEQPVAHPGILDEGQSVTCTITNDDLPSTITVVKVVVPDGAAAPDDFGLMLIPEGEFPIGVSSGQPEHVPANQTYTVAEMQIEGFAQIGLDCEDSDGPVQHPVDLGLDQHVTCILTNAESPTVTVIKTTDPESADLFSFRLSPGDTQLVAGNGGSHTWMGLEPGEFQLVEDTPVDWSLESVACDLEFSPLPSGAEFALDWGDHASCVFGNSELGSITVKKVTGIASDDLFDIDIEGAFLADSVQLGDGDLITWSMLPPGDYTVEEVLGNHDWHIALECSGGAAAVGNEVVTSAGKSRAAQIGLQFGDDVLCIFTNDPVLADLEVIKVDLVDPVVLDGEGATALIEYELTVTNHGPDPAYDVVVEDVLPESLTFVSVSSSDGPCAHSDGVIHCALGTMAVGDVVIISVVVETEPLGEVTEPEPVNVVEVGSSTQDPNPANNRDQEVTHIEEILPVEVLPFTGLHGERLAGVGLLLLGLGTGLVMVTIRRRRSYKGLHQA